jgi:hypothetical protein
MRVCNHGSYGEILAFLAGPSQQPYGPWLRACFLPERIGDGRAHETEH